MVPKIEKMLSAEASVIVDNAKKWFEVINQHPPQLASERIWEAMATICEK